MLTYMWLWRARGEDETQNNNLHPLTYFNTNSFWSVSLTSTVDKHIPVKFPRPKSQFFLLHVGKLTWPRTGKGRTKARLGLLIIIPMIFWPFHTAVSTIFSLLPSLLSDNGYGTYLFTYLLLFFFSVIYITLNPKLLHGNDQLFRQWNNGQFVLSRYL